jgi:hypothetical protein
MYPYVSKLILEILTKEISPPVTVLYRFVTKEQ